MHARADADFSSLVQGLEHFEVKIGDSNQASLALFKRLGFHVVDHSAVFEETCLLLTITAEQFGAQTWDEVSIKHQTLQLKWNSS